MNRRPNPRSSAIARRGPAPWVLLGLLLLPLAGCRGTGTVKAMPVARSDISDAEPLIQNVPLSEACYAIAEDGQVSVALSFHRDSWLGDAFDADWQMSLVLEGLPAGSSRLYKLKQDAARIVQSVGADRRRARGWTGIAVLHAPQGGRLRGRFHLNVRQQQFTLLNGWAPPVFQAPTMIMAGEFSAVENAARTHAIADPIRAAGD